MLLAEKYYTEDNFQSTLEKAPVLALGGRPSLPIRGNRAIHSYLKQINIWAYSISSGLRYSPVGPGREGRLGEPEPRTEGSYKQTATPDRKDASKRKYEATSNRI